MGFHEIFEKSKKNEESMEIEWQKTKKMHFQKLFQTHVFIQRFTYFLIS